MSLATSGYSVTLYDIAQPALDRALGTIQKNLDRQVSKDLLTAADAKAALGRIVSSMDLASAVAHADLVVEAATEREDLKLQIFRDLDALAPAGCILSQQHLIDFDWQDCRRDEAPRAGHWHALHESGSRDEVGGNHLRVQDLGGHDPSGHCAVRQPWVRSLSPATTIPALWPTAFSCP